MRLYATFHIAAPVAAIVITVSSCAVKEINKPVHQLRNYRFDASLSVDERVSSPPVFVLEHLRKLDNRPDYIPHLPSSAELSIIKKAVTHLPPLTAEIMKERLIGIYFIQNFLGSGLTEWVIDENDNIYTFMIFNSDVLSNNISGLLSSKEKSCFIPDDTSIDIKMDCGTDLNGFHYILLHESSHVVDYVKRITPYADKGIVSFSKGLQKDTGFTKSIWVDYDTATPRFSFSDRVTFYGMGGPKIKISEAVDIYRDLSRSPFASLYGSISWAEDLAEMVAFYHITEIMGRRFFIRVIKNGKNIYSLEPMKGALVRKRFAAIKQFYRK